jgi:hypothetical protein
MKNAIKRIVSGISQNMMPNVTHRRAYEYLADHGWRLKPSFIRLAFCGTKLSEIGDCLDSN